MDKCRVTTRTVAVHPPLGLLMSGTRHHFIPQFLQKGFASHYSGEKAFTWVYRRGVAPFNTNIINVGVEGHFYTTEGGTTADDLITSAEGALASLLDRIRSEGPECLRDPRIPVLIAHLEVRTRHLRESFLKTGQLLVSRLIDFLADEDAFAGYMTKKLERDPTVFRSSLAGEFVKRGIPMNHLESVLHLTTSLVPGLTQALRAEFPRMAAQLRDTLPIILKAAAKSGHIKALQRTIAPELRVQRYAHLTFRVARVTNTPLILGDSAVLYAVTGPRTYRAFLDVDADLSAVYLPIDSQHVLIGSQEGTVTDVPHDLSSAIARCSLEYFISAENSGQYEALRDQIGADAHMFEQSEIEDILNEPWQ